MAKTPTSFRLSEEEKELLAKIAKQENRSEANMLGQLIREKAAALGITAPKS